MIFKETQEEGFDLISFYNRLNNILYSYINDYVYNEDIDIYYKMILNIINKFNYEYVTNQQDLYNKYNKALHNMMYIYCMLKTNYLKEHNIDSYPYINFNTSLTVFYNQLKSLDKSYQRKTNSKYI